MTNPIEILYEDGDLIAINKPAGLLVVEDGYHQELPNLKRYLIESRENIWTVHRLDKTTSGVIVFAKTADAHRTLNMAFSSRQVVKQYHALVHGFPFWSSLNLSIPLLKNGDRFHRSIYHPSRGKMTCSCFEVIQKNEAFSHMRVFPKTGYTHQIRAHLSTLGFPILGDDLYIRSVSIHRNIQTSSANPERIFLHAFSISFQHPITKKVIRINAPNPAEFMSKLFELGFDEIY